MRRILNGPLDFMPIVVAGVLITPFYCVKGSVWLSLFVPNITACVNVKRIVKKVGTPTAKRGWITWYFTRVIL